MRDHLGFGQVIKDINDSMGYLLNEGELKLYGHPKDNHEWMIWHEGEVFGAPDGFIYNWIWEYTEDSASLVGCPPTLDLVLECVYQEKIDKIYPKMVPYLKRWAAGGNGEYGEPGYWGEHQ